MLSEKGVLSSDALDQLEEHLKPLEDLLGSPVQNMASPDDIRHAFSELVAFWDSIGSAIPTLRPFITETLMAKISLAPLDLGSGDYTFAGAGEAFAGSGLSSLIGSNFLQNQYLGTPSTSEFFHGGSGSGGGFINLAPTDIILSNNFVPENVPIWTFIGSLTGFDPNLSSGDVLTFSLTTNPAYPDNAFFQIGSIRANANYNFESTKTSYTIQVKVTDLGGLSREETFTINVTNVNEAPTSITLSDPAGTLTPVNSIEENLTSETTIGILGTQDPDAEDTSTYALVEDEGYPDNSYFS
ncbi:MAG: cadherin repeat domain-containing protein, partial [Alphaproteobacteria bacterium]